MTAVTRALLAELSAAELEELADRLRPFIKTSDPRPYFNTKQAAEYIGAKPGRIHDPGRAVTWSRFVLATKQHYRQLSLADAGPIRGRRCTG